MYLSSTASVSRVLNHPDKVSERIRAKVTLAMDELGYVRDGADVYFERQSANILATVRLFGRFIRDGRILQ